MKHFLLLTMIIGTVLQLNPIQAQEQKQLPLIPYPQKTIKKNGHFTINTQTELVADKALLANEIERLEAIIGNATLKNEKPNNNYIELKLDPQIQQSEGYHLQISPQHVILSAQTPKGIFRGIETIRQLLQNHTLPSADIQDFPLYSYRGMHLDVSRHFFSLDYLKKFIDRLAIYKFNKLHLHLTDDQGWRIEIKKYPLLTQNGAFRKFNNQDSICIERSKATHDPSMYPDPKFITVKGKDTIYGGFYTQEEMQEIVRYAQARHIDIIPEIDMPGHMNAAIQNYPYLACSSEIGWGDGEVFTVPICPCNESTFEFAENIFKEIFQIFPYEYVHIGADEVNKKSWKSSAACKVLMEKEGLKDVDELQSHFVKRMEKFFNAHGKKLIGWDEILEGGISPTANVMYWRSWVKEAPILAAQNGNKVIMTPGNPLYFDYTPNNKSIEEVYKFNPVPTELDSISARNIIGAQANIWTEWIPTESRLEYMVYPRKLALSEVLWSNKKNFKSFKRRLNKHLPMLKKMNINYRLPDIENVKTDNVFIHKATLQAKSPSDKYVIRYTRDNTEPTAQSPILSKPIEVSQSITFKMALFEKERRGDILVVNYKQQQLKPSLHVAADSLSVALYDGFFKSVNEMDSIQPIRQWKQSDLFFNKEKIGNLSAFGLIYKGYISVPEDGIYTFYLTSDDGSILSIANEIVVNNDGLHSSQEKEGQIALKKGRHNFLLKFAEGGGGHVLKLEKSLPGQTKKEKGYTP